MSTTSKKKGFVRKAIDRLTRNRWEIRRCLWPFPEGYATFNPGTNTILDTGLTKQRAQEICDQMNETTTQTP
jgi:hypothetical protein